MYQDKKEEETSPALWTVQTHQYKHFTRKNKERVNNTINNIICKMKPVNQQDTANKMWR